MKFLMFSGSLRKDSLNRKLLEVVQKRLLSNSSHSSTLVDLKSFSIPVYDGDVEALEFPKGVMELGELIKVADALIISSPEYNASIAGSLKNTIDWLSRLNPVPLEDKPVLLMGASPGYFGAIRALGHSRDPFNTLGSYVYPESFALPKASEAFANPGELKDSGVQKRLHELLDAFADFAFKFRIQ